MAPRLVYDKRGIQLWQGDCRNVLPTLSPDSVDLLLTDPPYGIEFVSNRGQNFGSMAGDDTTKDVMEALTLAMRVMRHKRHLYVFGDLPLDTLPITKPVELVWNKGAVGMGNLTIPWAKTHEHIQFASHIPSKKNREDGNGRLSARLRQGTVLSVPRMHSKQNLDHPTEKPVKLLRMLIESSTVLDDVVLDPFVGVGSTLVAALLEGRRAIGIEIEPEYCEIARQRLEDVVIQGG